MICDYVSIFMARKLISPALVDDIRHLILSGRTQVVTAVNVAMVSTYWAIGRRIVEEEQQGQARAEYGTYLLQELSHVLTQEFGKGFHVRNLQMIRKFYLTFPIANTLCSQLSWSHYRLLLRLENKEARDFYLKEAAAAQWSVRQLERQMQSFYFERLLASPHKNLVEKEAQATGIQLVNTPEQILKDPFILEFLDLKENKDYLEKDLEEGLTVKLADFLLELGRGFAFVERQQRITTESGDHYYIDLVFYNYLLRCFVLIDLKRGKLSHQDIGQMDMYVRLYEKFKRQEGDNPTVGLILCSDNDKTVMEYSMLKESKQLFASKYQLYLPTQEEVARLLGVHHNE